MQTISFIKIYKTGLLMNEIMHTYWKGDMSDQIKVSASAPRGGEKHKRKVWRGNVEEKLILETSKKFSKKV